MENTEKMQVLIEKAGILIEALPYIRKLNGKTVVVTLHAAAGIAAFGIL